MIRGFIGLMGQGKTLSMIRKGRQALLKGRRVITNTPFFVMKNGKKLLPEYVETQEFLSLLQTEKDAVFLLDEASIVFSNYSLNLMKGDWIMRFAQVRKMGLQLWYTTQGFNHIQPRIQQLTYEVVECKKTLPFLFQNFAYSRDAFANPKMPPRMRQSYLLYSETIWPWELKELYKSYDTFFTIESSEILKKEVKTQVHNDSKFLTDFLNVDKFPRKILL